MTSRELCGPWFRDLLSGVIGDPSAITDGGAARVFDLITSRRLGQRERMLDGPDPAFVGVTRGLVRVFFERGDGKNWNKQFIADGDLGGPFGWMSSGNEYQLGVEALEDSELLLIPFDALKQRASADAEVGTILAGLLERALRRKGIREKELTCMDASERYQRFLAEYSELSGRVPQYHIASYLGITEVQLSRLRGRVHGDNPGRDPG